MNHSFSLNFFPLVIAISIHSKGNTDGTVVLRLSVKQKKGKFGSKEWDWPKAKASLLMKLDLQPLDLGPLECLSSFCPSCPPRANSAYFKLFIFSFSWVCKLNSPSQVGILKHWRGKLGWEIFLLWLYAHSWSPFTVIGTSQNANASG